MRFTKYNSMEDILSYPKMDEYLKVFYSEFLLEMFPEKLYKEPLALAENFGKTPWEEPFSVVADQLIDAANIILDIFESKTRRCISLWDARGGDWSLAHEKKGGKDQVFLLAPVRKDNTAKEASQTKELQARKPAVIICPGGGYEAVCFSGEGNPALHFMEAQGYCTFILKYRTAPERYPKPQEDLALAIMYVRSHADYYGIDPNDILLIGSSAGGHLCALEAALYEEMEGLISQELKSEAPEMAEYYQSCSARPDKLCLCYPVISFSREPHEGSFLALTGEVEEMRKTLSVEDLVTESYPPTFVWTCEDDDCVPPSNAAIMADALEAKKVRHELHLYPSGGHGCALAFSKSAYTWSRSMINFMKKDSFDTPRG